MTAVTIIGMATVGTQQVYGPRACPGCGEFKKMTTEFEREVIDAAIGNPNDIPALVDEYAREVKALFENPPETE